MRVWKFWIFSVFRPQVGALIGLFFFPPSLPTGGGGFQRVIPDIMGEGGPLPSEALHLVVNCQNVILEILDFFHYFVHRSGCSSASFFLRVLRSWPSLRSAPFHSLAALASLHLAPLRYARATNYATAKAPLDFGLVGPSLWTSTAAWLYCTNLVSFVQGV